MKKTKHYLCLLILCFITIGYGQSDDENDCDHKLKTALTYLTQGAPLPESYQESIVDLTSDCLEIYSTDAFLVKGIYQWQGYISEPDELTAFYNIEHAALFGNQEAAFLLGLFYKNGIGVEQNFIKAKEWFTISADAGNQKALFALGYFYLKG
ncbi:hypothetical protein GCM10022393_00560 [Aquimarina addita]|uniref:Sel1 repeat family protein n=1 Tax=Aquimarina addita TaxID=870485 RepID=A0ABP7X7Q6_9FLAO